MSIEGGSSAGSGGGGGAPGGGIGPAGGPSISVGIEGGLSGASPGGFRGFGEFGDLGQFRSLGPAALGLEVKSLASPILDESPVGKSFLESSMPLVIGQLNPVNEIKFNDPVQSGGVSVEDLSVKAVIAEAESIIAQAQNPLKELNSVVEMKQPEYELPSWQLTVPQIEPRVIPMAVPNKLEYPNPRVFFSPALEPATRAENKTEAMPDSATNVKSTVQQAQTLTIPEAVKAEEQTEEVLVEEKVKKDTKDTPEEGDTIEAIKYLEDEQALGQRRYEIREAIVKASAEAGRLGLTKIAGWLVAKFLPAEHSDNRSQVIKNNGPDGSYQETVDAIAAVGEMESNEKAAERLSKIVLEKPPVKYGKVGTAVAQEDVARVYKYKGVVKPFTEAYETVYKRVMKKKDKVISVNTPTLVSLNNQSKPDTSLTFCRVDTTSDFGLKYQYSQDVIFVGKKGESSKKNTTQTLHINNRRFFYTTLR